MDFAVIIVLFMGFVFVVSVVHLSSFVDGVTGRTAYLRTSALEEERFCQERAAADAEFRRKLALPPGALVDEVAGRLGL